VGGGDVSAGVPEGFGVRVAEGTRVVGSEKSPSCSMSAQAKREKIMKKRAITGSRYLAFLSKRGIILPMHHAMK
jgi:hypothetical protein